MIAILKKVIVYLLGDKKGRKLLLYIGGIATFLLLLPVIAIYGLFGWMSGDDGNVIDRDIVMDYVPDEGQEQIEVMEETCNEIESVFSSYGLSEEDELKAHAMYISYLMGKEEDGDFCDVLAECFRDSSDEKNVYDLAEEAFDVDIPDYQRERIDELYGVTESGRGTVDEPPDESDDTAQAPEPEG